MCAELNYATTTLYRTAKYLALANLVHADMREGRLELPESARCEMMRLIETTGKSLAGDTGAGIVAEQQESIAEMMWDSARHVITNFEFRKRLLELPGWEQYTALFVFFLSEDDNLDPPLDGRIRFVPKLPHEIKNTIQALSDLESNPIRGE
jgi:hypothetical protein